MDDRTRLTRILIIVAAGLATALAGCGDDCYTPAGNLRHSCGSYCGSGQTLCNGVCVLLQSDPNNCGACGTTCPTGETCSSSRCSCVAWLDLDS